MALFIAFVYPFLIHFFTKLDLPGNIGEFGDMYGVLNPVISALAFFGVMYSLFLQQKQIRLQREDLKNQRADLKLQRDEMVKQREVSEAQTRQFESQVRQAKTAQKVDELYRRLSIVVQLGTVISTSYDRSRNDVFIERVSETGICAIRRFHIMILQKLFSIADKKATMESESGYFLDRYEIMASWVGAMMDVLHYTVNNFDSLRAIEFVRTIMSTCSNPHKFFIYLYAGAENHEMGQQMRCYLLNNGFIPRRIIPVAILDNEFMVDFDRMLMAASSYGEINQ